MSTITDQRQNVFNQAGSRKMETRVPWIYRVQHFKYESSEQMGKNFDLEEADIFIQDFRIPLTMPWQKICDLEGGLQQCLLPLDKQQISMIMNIAEAGDHIVCASALYGEPIICMPIH